MTMIKLQKLLRKQAGITKRTMLDSLASGIWMPETGITAKNLQVQRLKHPLDIRVMDFSPIVENRTTGADWLWLFESPTDVFGIAIQAKRQDGTGRYEICYRPKKGKGKKKAEMQIKTLLKFAQKTYVDPTYCFYNHIVPINAGAVIGYNALPSTDPAWGCSLAGAHAIKQYTTKKKNVSNTPDNSHIRLLPYAIPWHEIFSFDPCPSLMSSGVSSSSLDNWVNKIRVASRALNRQGAEMPELSEPADDRKKFLRELIDLIDAKDYKKVLRRLGDKPPRHIAVVRKAAPQKGVIQFRSVTKPRKSGANGSAPKTSKIR